MWQAAYHLLTNGQMEQAVQLCRAALAQNPEAFQERFLLGIALCQTGNGEQAVQELRPLAERFPSHAALQSWLTQSHAKAGETALAAHRLEDAAFHLQQALTLDPVHGECRTRLAHVHVLRGRSAEQAGLWTEAAEHYGQATALVPEQPVYRLWQQKMTGIGACLAGDLHRAATAFLDCLTWAEAQPGMVYDVVRILVQHILPLADRQGFARICQILGYRSLHQFHSFFAAHNLVTRPESTVEILAFCQAYRASHGDSDIVLLAMGALAALLGEREQAAAAYQAILNRFPDHPPALQGQIGLIQQPDDLAGTAKTVERPSLRCQAAKPRLRLVVHSNCQGEPIGYGLRRILEDRYQVDLAFVRNYEATAFMMERQADCIRQADIALFQPRWVLVEGQRVQTMPLDLAAVLPSSCLRISFPYVFNSAVWPLIQDGDQILTSEAACARIRGASSMESVLNAYDRDDLDFQFESRYQRFLTILRQREGFTDVKVSGFIAEQFPHQCLFVGNRHPRHPLFSEMVRQILRILPEKGLDVSWNRWEWAVHQADYREFIARRFACEFLPVDPATRRHFGLGWLSAEQAERGRSYYRHLLRWAAEGRLRLVADGQQGDLV